MLSFLACSNKEPESSDALQAEISERAKNGEEYLAYEHSAAINLNREDIETTFNSVTGSCNSSTEYQCVVLDSEITGGDYVSAVLRLRLSPEFVEPILSLAANKGEINRKSTHAEDLAEPIVDSERQLAMLESYLEELLSLKSQSNQEVDALISLTSEIAKTQSKLEALRGENAYLKQRVKLDILSLSFHAERNQSFLTPIADAVGDFGEELSWGISEAITGFAYLLPWLVILIPLLFLIRYLWRKWR
jgi:hypothetical protein